MLFDFASILNTLEPLWNHSTPDIASPLLIYDPTSRRSHINALHDRIQEVNDICQGIEKLHEQVSKLRHQWNRHRAVVHNALAPIHALPDEILAELMIQLVHSDDKNKTQFTLSHVSQRMR